MSDVFPEPITRLAQADVPFAGCMAYLSQADTHQIVFWQFDRDVDVPEHSHAAQWGMVVEGSIEMTIGGMIRTYTKGDHYTIPAGVRHRAKVHAGYADITFFDQKDRYHAR